MDKRDKTDTEWTHMGWPICVSVLLLLVAALVANRMALETDLQRGERCLEAQEERK